MGERKGLIGRKFIFNYINNFIRAFYIITLLRKRDGDLNCILPPISVS